MSKKGHVAIRMCVGCRKRGKKDEMIRWIRSGNGLKLARNAQTEGRGVYLCRDVMCLRKAQKKMGPFCGIELPDSLYRDFLGGVTNVPEGFRGGTEE